MNYFKGLLKLLLVLAVLGGLGAGLGALFMVLGGAILTSAGWSVMGMSSLMNIGLVAGAILLPIPLFSGFVSLDNDEEDVAKGILSSSYTSGAILGLVGAAVLGMTAGMQLGYVAAAGAIGIAVGIPGLAIGLVVIAALAYGIYQLGFSVSDNSNNHTKPTYRVDPPEDDNDKDNNDNNNNDKEMTGLATVTKPLYIVEEPDNNNIDDSIITPVHMKQYTQCGGSGYSVNRGNRQIEFRSQTTTNITEINNKTSVSSLHLSQYTVTNKSSGPGSFSMNVERNIENGRREIEAAHSSMNRNWFPALASHQQTQLHYSTPIIPMIAASPFPKTW